MCTKYLCGKQFSTNYTFQRIKLKENILNCSTSFVLHFVDLHRQVLSLDRFTVINCDARLKREDAIIPKKKFHNFKKKQKNPTTNKPKKLKTHVFEIHLY